MYFFICHYWKKYWFKIKELIYFLFCWRHWWKMNSLHFIRFARISGTESLCLHSISHWVGPNLIVLAYLSNCLTFQENYLCLLSILNFIPLCLFLTFCKAILCFLSLPFALHLLFIFLLNVNFYCSHFLWRQSILIVWI